jgi:hypothetical protein
MLGARANGQDLTASVALDEARPLRIGEMAVVQRRGGEWRWARLLSREVAGLNFAVDNRGGYKIYGPNWQHLVRLPAAKSRLSLSPPSISGHSLEWTKSIPSTQLHESQQTRILDHPTAVDKSMCTVDWGESSPHKAPWWTVEAQLQREWVGEPMIDVSSGHK